MGTFDHRRRGGDEVDDTPGLVARSLVFEAQATSLVQESHSRRCPQMIPPRQGCIRRGTKEERTSKVSRLQRWKREVGKQIRPDSAHHHVSSRRVEETISNQRSFGPIAIATGAKIKCCPSPVKHTLHTAQCGTAPRGCTKH